ncbi:helix-turn-helix domain-containing protein [Rhodobacteraceae bacterium NNCM2]|nr:helix-turn-helix domain-containing protein [Coraliihabitans acroporae]
MTQEQPRSSGQVRSLTRALSLLRHLAASSDGMTLTELAEASGLPPSTTHRLLTTLEAERFVRPDSSGGIWRIGVASFFVGSAFARSRDILTMARPYLRRLMEMSGETSNLFLENDSEAVCIGQIESRHAMRAITGVGGRVMLHSSGAGKALLAFLEPARQAMLVNTMTYRIVTPTTITDREGLTKELARIRAAGYAIDDEEHALGLRCVAAPVFDEFGHSAAAISVSGPAARIPSDRLAALGKLVAQAAAEATREYGGIIPSEG